MATPTVAASGATAPAPAPPRPRRRGRRWLVGVLVGIVVLLAAGYVAVGWYVSGEIIGAMRVAAPSPVEYDTEVVALTGSEIMLVRPDEAALEADRDAVMGLSWDGGYGQIGPAASFDGGTEIRPFTLLYGTPPPVGLDAVDVDSFAFPPDPTLVGLDVTTVTYPGPLGDHTAWQLPGEGSTWLLIVHGRGAGLHDGLRLVDATRELAYPTLLVTYRNDQGAPATDDALLRYGQDEWEDLAAAVAYAQANGAQDVVLGGISLGGAISLGYALEGDAEVVRGMVLEAPMTDFREAVRLRSGEALPVGGVIGDLFLASGRAFVRLRTGLDFDAVDYVARADGLTMPLLVFHGEDDPEAPIAVSESLAAARPDLVEFHPVPDAHHVRAWNEDPAGYTATVADFLQRIGRSD